MKIKAHLIILLTVFVSLVLLLVSARAKSLAMTHSQSDTPAAIVQAMSSLAPNTPDQINAGVTSRVSVASDGTQANGNSNKFSISGDGRYVAFASSANNLVGGDTNGEFDIFVHDRQTGETTRISVASNGTQGNNRSYDPSISADGRYVAFFSYASNLVSGDTNGSVDAFVHDRQTGETTRISVATDGSQGNDNSYSSSISGTGRYITFFLMLTIWSAMIPMVMQMYLSTTDKREKQLAYRWPPTVPKEIMVPHPLLFQLMADM